MDNIHEYKGYLTKIEYSAEDNLLFGKIEGIDDLISFQACTCDEVEKAFHEAVDDYLQFCKEVGKSPDKAYKGSYNVRISPQLHRALANKAYRDGYSLNQATERAIEQYLNSMQWPENTFTNTLYTFANPDAPTSGMVDITTYLSAKSN